SGALSSKLTNPKSLGRERSKGKGKEDFRMREAPPEKVVVSLLARGIMGLPGLLVRSGYREGAAGRVFQQQQR
ncbi:MAG: hypothetical protein WCS37_22465, partial [Chloroflexota bacterium]